MLGVNVLPLAATLADFAENFFLLRMLHVFPNTAVFAGTVGGAITTSKQVFLFLSVLALILFGLRIGIKRRPIAGRGLHQERPG